MLRHADPRRVAGASVLVVLLAFFGLSLGSTMAKGAHAPGAVVGFWRLLIGAVLWHVLIWLHGARTGGPRRVDARAWRLATLPGIVFGVNICFFFSGVDRTPIAHAEFISALTPVILVPLTALTLKERVPARAMLAGVAAIAGITLILSRAPSGHASYLGDLLILGAVATWMAYLTTGRAARARLATVEFMAVMTTVACITTLPIALATSGGAGPLLDLTAQGWILVALLAVVTGMAAHALLAWSQGRVALGTIALIQLVQPGLAALWGATFLGESIAPIQLVGIAVVLGSVGVVVRATAKPMPAPVRPARPSGIGELAVPKPGLQAAK